jgi:two-component system, chemotaxis family, CheB/CheR fusion protein
MAGRRQHLTRTTRSPDPARSEGGRPASEAFPVVGIGASAGGLDAASQLLDALPKDSDAAFILIQHLDPTHPSLMAGLLAEHTAMPVSEATDGVQIAPGHVYVIPPGTYLAASDGVLRLSQPQARHGARLPFDFLLRSLADAYGSRAVCVVLSGSGADGSLGLRAVREKGGLIIAQDPREAAHDGMPRSAIATGAVDLVLSIADVPAALAQFARHLERAPANAEESASTGSQATDADWTLRIVDLLRRRTAHDFTLYKSGTVRRRIERRMSIAAIDPDDMGRYLDLLETSQDEIDLLAKDLLINVTSFFRDPLVFQRLAETTIPDMLREHPRDQSLRVWVVGCSTGEEAYSIAMLLREAITAAESNVKLQIFASDVDSDAVAIARDGLYPETIAADVSAPRLEHFFSREEGGYRVSPELRSAIVFTVQDLLLDPPFSRIDLISCRNLLIYLTPEAQTRAIALFHFSLRQGGALLLGSAETIGDAEDRFAAISKPDRLYRHVGRSRPGDLALAIIAPDGLRVPARGGKPPQPARQTVLAELSRRMVMETYAPAAVLINAKGECLHLLGPTDRYLRVAPGAPTHDLIAMSPQGLRGKMRSAIQQARRDGARHTIGGCSIAGAGGAVHFSLDVQPVTSEGEDLLLISFIEQPPPEQRRGGARIGTDASRVVELEAELEASRTELQAAVRSLELSSEEQKAINEEALSVNEEFQSTNEELLTSKEELQSLNEELTALNSQLHESLEKQKTSSNDLQNIIYSTDLAMLFLDLDLNIRFFTPTTRSLFNVIPSDIGRPLADLASLAPDLALAADARAVLDSRTPVERDIETAAGLCFTRRILPYRTLDNGVEGVIITFIDVTEARHAAKALEASRAKAEQADAAKSRFLAVASHDLRQPLQSLALIHGLLSRTVLDDRAKGLAGRLEQTVGLMTGMLNTLLDINQIEAGVVHPSPVSFVIGDILQRIGAEFSLQALSQKLDLRVISCRRSIRSDPRLIEQMIRNLVSNALKYTRKGKILIGCRRRGDQLAIEIWDTGIGIAPAELTAIFEAYHQIDNPARERSRGLGLGLAIVDRLARLLELGLRVESLPGKGSVFVIEAPMAADLPAPPIGPLRAESAGAESASPGPASSILIVEDDKDVGELLELFLKGEGHHVARIIDGASAVKIVAQGKIRPDLVLADYKLPGALDGLGVAAELRQTLGRQVPVVMITGDISISTLRTIAEHDCVQLSKPVSLGDLSQVIRSALPPVGSPGPTRPPTEDLARAATIFVVDDDRIVREDLREVLEEGGYAVRAFESCEAFLDADQPGEDACIVVDGYLPGMSGLDLLSKLKSAGDQTPAIMVTGKSDTPMVVQAMKAGAWDFIEKPVGRDELLTAIERALEQSRDSFAASAWRTAAAKTISTLTPRQRQIMDLVLEGHPSKNIAADLGISQRTVENHRASIMSRMGARSLPALARMVLVGGERPDLALPIGPPAT